MRLKKNILFIPSWYPSAERPFLGNFIQNQVELIAKTNSVYVLNTELSDGKKPHTTVQQKGNVTEYTVYITAKNKLSRLFQEKRLLSMVFNQIPAIDVVLGAVLFQKGYQFIWAKKHFKAPLLLVEHSSVYHAKNWTKTQKIIFNKTKDHIDEIIAVSETLKMDLAPYFREKPIRVIGNHIDTALFRPKEKKQRKTVQFLHVSTLAEKTKNPGLLFETFKHLLDIHSDFHLTVVCDEDFSTWYSYCLENGLIEKITFVGPTSQEDIVKYYDEADFIILTSLYETFSIVLLESWATQTPTISFEVGVNKPFQENFGLEIKENNARKLSKQLAELITNKSQFDNEGMRNFAIQFSKENIAKLWNQAIDRHAQ